MSNPPNSDKAKASEPKPEKAEDKPQHDGWHPGTRRIDHAKKAVP